MLLNQLKYFQRRLRFYFNLTLRPRYVGNSGWVEHHSERWDNLKDEEERVILAVCVSHMFPVIVHKVLL